MYTLSKSFRTKDKPSGPDTAYIQFALKHMKGKYAKNYLGPTNYRGSINGKWSDEVDSRLAHIGYPLGVDNISDSSVSVRHLRGINKKLPAKFAAYEFVPYKIGSNWRLFLLKKSDSAAPMSTKPLALPAEEAKAFRKILARLKTRFSVHATIAKQTVDSEGRFLINLDLEVGKRIDPKSGEIKKFRERLPKEYRKFIISVLASSTNNDKWEMFDKNAIVLRSVKKFETLKLSGDHKRRVLRALGYKSNNKEGASASVDHCMAAYEKAVILDELSPELEAQLTECFGQEKQAILSNQKARRTKCLVYLQKLVSLDRKHKKSISTLSYLQNRLSEIKAEYDVEDDDDIDREVAERLLEATQAILPGRARGPKSGKLANAAAEASLEALGKVRSDSNDNTDLEDNILHAIAIAGLVIGFIATGGVPLLIAAILTTVAKVGSVGKAIYEIIQLEGVRGELKAIASEVMEASNSIALLLDRIHAVLSAFQAEGCDKGTGDIFAIIKNGELELDTGDVFVSYAARRAYLNGN